jgi:hypothetical protein
MNDRTAALLRALRLSVAALALPLVGCAAGAAPAAALAPRVAMAVEAAPAEEISAGVAPNSLQDLAPLALAPAAAPAPAASCRAESAKGFTGFYANDAWADGEVVLTFDDGPHPTATPRVLELLKQNAMPATFFLVGRNISRDTYPLVQRMVAEGHILASHSYSHDVHMTRVGAPAVSHQDIVGQHRVTAILIDMALLATSADDFDAMFVEVFRSEPASWLTGSTIRKEHAAFSARHQALLAERGLAAGSRAYDVLYSRPPGGGPYVQHDGAAGMAIHDAALAELSMMNVLWHGASGDTDPAQRSDFGYLTANMDEVARKGGVLLIHDYIRADALAKSLATIAASDELRVVTMDQAVEAKFGCDRQTMSAALRGPAGASAIEGHQASR